ncbi:MAG: hypothetical protein KTR24_11800, partial [Saprospiraceae bacterium]|nr:hypothetical protein [Saprospiraceae bacterium]
MLRTLTIVCCLLLALYVEGFGQCTHTFSSTNGYDLHVELDPELICTAGGRFTSIMVHYTVSATGSNVPIDPIDILRVDMTCASPAFTIHIPDQLGSGQEQSTPRRMDCAGHSLASMGCTEMMLT